MKYKNGKHDGMINNYSNEHVTQSFRCQFSSHVKIVVVDHNDVVFVHPIPKT
jgi:hypothetical protein